MLGQRSWSRVAPAAGRSRPPRRPAVRRRSGLLRDRVSAARQGRLRMRRAAQARPDRPVSEEVPEHFAGEAERRRRRARQGVGASRGDEGLDVSLEVGRSAERRRIHRSGRVSRSVREGDEQDPYFVDKGPPNAPVPGRLTASHPIFLTYAGRSQQVTLRYDSDGVLTNGVLYGTPTVAWLGYFLAV